ncbi:MAG: PD-(D/E)XK nuclease-like domain-containing protein [Solirubrobacteraceae bacterium]
MKAGVYDIASAVYYADGLTEEPSLNATVLKALINDSARHAFAAHPKLNPDYAEKTDRKFDLGTVAHEVYLLGNDKRVHVVDAADWRTKAAQEVRDRAREEGLVPLLAHEWQRVSAMLTALRAQLPKIDAEPPLFTAGKAERTLVWRDRDVLCRARMDWLHDSHECADDLKTAGRTANPHVWTRTTMFSIGADLQAAFTLRGLRAALGVESTFRFVICEVHEPYAISAVTPSAQTLALANQKIDVALEKWKRCLESDEWPAFPRHVLTVDPPPWLETQWWEAQQVDEAIEAAAA